ncbi:ROK family protein [Enterococcus sp. DIV0170]|uniref:ROK family protein n=1 Tax=Enterococcus sp. DIV0170 TaxID=2774642 RepID=UPI003F28B71E
MEKQNKKIIGVDIGGTAIKFALMDTQGIIEKKWSIPTNISEKGRYIPAEIGSSILSSIDKNTLRAVEGIGIGVPGAISSDGAVVVQAVNLGWEQLPLKKMIEGEIGLEACLLNDANAAALGEMWKGAARGRENLLFVTLGTGVGGGIILNGEVLNGCHSAGGEIGHIPIRTDENRLCGCGGRNCLETFASANGLMLSMRKKLEQLGESWTEVTPPIIFKKAAQNNIAAKEVLNDFTTVLAQALAGIMNTIDVEEIIIGGGVSEAGADLLDPLMEKLEMYVFPSIKDHFSLRKALLGNDAGIYGAGYFYLTKSAR